MKIKLSILFVFLIILLSCTMNKNKKKLILSKVEIPQGAIPIEYHSHIYVKGIVDSVQCNFVFDTGASNLYIDTLFYAMNNLKHTNFFNAYLPGAGNKPQKVKVIKDSVKFEFNNKTYKTSIVPILKLKPILGDIADRILVMEYFYNSCLEINYHNQYMMVHKTLNSISLKKYDKIKLSMLDNRLMIPLKVAVNDSIEISGNYLLDIGSGGSIDIGTPFAKKYKLNKNIKDKVYYYTKYGGIGGESGSYTYYGKSITMGKYIIKKPLLDYSTDKRGAYASKKRLGVLGNEILERFDLIIDFKELNLYIKPNEKLNKEFKSSKLGFAYNQRQKTLGCIMVTGIYKGSNAERSGLKIDDKIIKINKIDVTKLNFRQVKKEMVKKDFIELTVLKENQIKVIKFKLKEIL